tara:strand:+ start:15269 stop:15451 length:183 start_codon:yes stop_codon:yes gene_type:complete
MAYAGLESGDPVTLGRIKKGMTPEQALEGMTKAKAAGEFVMPSPLQILEEEKYLLQHLNF